MADPNAPVEPGGQEAGGGEPGGGGGGSLGQDRFVSFTERFDLRAPKPERFRMSQIAAEDEMQLFSYHNFGDTSDEVGTIVELVQYYDLSNPALDALLDLDWNGAGYAIDGAELDGSDIGGGPRAELRYYQYRLGRPQEFAKVIVQGQEIPANGIPFRYAAAQHKMATLVRNVPKTKGIVYECAIVFKRPGAATPIVFKYQQAIG